MALTIKQVPFTGPYYGPSHPKGPMKGPTALALKRFAIRLGVMSGDLAELDEHYNAKLEKAMKLVQAMIDAQRSGQYGETTWAEGVRKLRVPSGPHKGEYALDTLGRALIRDEYAATLITICYPSPLGAFSVICQGLHETGGLDDNWAIDYCAPPGTPILVVEDAVISKLSGSDPNADVPDSQGTFGWNIYYTTAAGYRYFWTHFGRKAALFVGQQVKMGTILGWVGDQDFRPDHIHGGVTSPNGEADAKVRITEVSVAPRIPAL